MTVAAARQRIEATLDRLIESAAANPDVSADDIAAIEGVAGLARSLTWSAAEWLDAAVSRLALSHPIKAGLFRLWMRRKGNRENLLDRIGRALDELRNTQ